LQRDTVSSLSILEWQQPIFLLLLFSEEKRVKVGFCLSFVRAKKKVGGGVVVVVLQKLPILMPGTLA